MKTALPFIFFLLSCVRLCAQDVKDTFFLPSPVKEFEDPGCGVPLGNADAEFPGGDEALNRYFERKISLMYPKKAKRKKIQGVVNVQFIINKDGYANDIQIISGPDALKDAAMDLMKKMCRWIPAIKDGRYIVTNHTASIKFFLPKKQK